MVNKENKKMDNKQYKDNIAYIKSEKTVKKLLEERAIQSPDHVVLKDTTLEITYKQLNESVNRLANGLISIGVIPGTRIAVMLNHHEDHITTFFALAKLGAVLIPVNVNLSGEPLSYLLSHSQPEYLIAEQCFEGRLSEAVQSIVPQHNEKHEGSLTYLRRESEKTETSLGNEKGFEERQNLKIKSLSEYLNWHNDASPTTEPKSTDVLAICYTSGTTGAPKGAFISDKMYRASAVSSLILSGIDDGDVLLFWEPIYHLFGIEVLVLATMRSVTLGMVEKFSASKFWDQARYFGATHIHYVGGVPQLLMKQPSSENDSNNPVRVAWGGGCPINIWRTFEQRFGLHMRDSFGMTETASLNIINIEGEPGALGKPLPYFQARIVNESGKDVKNGETGQLLIKCLEPNLITSGYYKNPEATAAAYQNGWFHTGDLVRQDNRGIYFFVGRQKDSIRRRGENISAWEVERIIGTHPEVEESALIPVSNEFGDEEIKAFIKPRSVQFDPKVFFEWCEGKMARYQIPRFVQIVDEFPKTPTQRIMKHKLSRSTTDCWDRGE